MKRSQKKLRKRKRYLKRMHPKGAHGKSKRKLTNIIKSPQKEGNK